MLASSTPMEAVEHAQRVREDHCQATQAQHPSWRALGVPHTSGRAKRRWEPSSCAGFNSREIHTVVLPVEPQQPLLVGLFRLMDRSRELLAYFRRVGGG